VLSPFAGWFSMTIWEACCRSAQLGLGGRTWMAVFGELLSRVVFQLSVWHQGPAFHLAIYWKLMY
jgi:hypothetical protein